MALSWKFLPVVQKPIYSFPVERDTGGQVPPEEDKGKPVALKVDALEEKKLLCFIVREIDLQPLEQRTFYLMWPGSGTIVEDKRVGICSQETWIWCTKLTDPSQVI